MEVELSVVKEEKQKIIEKFKTHDYSGVSTSVEHTMTDDLSGEVEVSPA